MSTSNRINRQDYFMEVVASTAKRSTCTRHQVGAVLVRDNRIVATGYNGVLPNVPPLQGLDAEGNSHTVHAEANIIAFCAKYGIATEGCTLYISLSPCEKCSELIVQAGISRIIYLDKYRDETGLKILKNNGVVSNHI